MKYPAPSKAYILKKRLLLAWSTLLLRVKSAAAGLRTSGYFRKNGVRRRVYMRGVHLWMSLSLCLFVSAGAITVAALNEREPKLLDLNGALPLTYDIIVVDPNRRDEFQLSPGTLYDRPIAAIQTGTRPVLMRARLEGTLLVVERDEKGLVVAALPTSDPGDSHIPRTVSQEAALQILINNGFCKKNTAWEDVFETRLPSRRLPGGNNEGGRLLVFEKKTVTVNQNTDIELPDLDALLPEDIEAMNLSKTTYAYVGFYLVTDVDETPLYQPLRVSLESARQGDRPPAITAIQYEYFRWETLEREVHLFGPGETGPVALESSGALPLAAWAGPADGWFYDADGWAYYGQSLEPGVMTPLLLENFSVGPESPLLKDETRYRLRVRVQTAPLDRDAVLAMWNNGQNLEGLGVNEISQEAARLAGGILGIE